jgi:hypothetical protein
VTGDRNRHVFQVVGILLDVRKTLIPERRQSGLALAVNVPELGLSRRFQLHIPAYRTPALTHAPASSASSLG